MVTTSTISQYGGQVVHANPLLHQDNIFKKDAPSGHPFFVGFLYESTGIRLHPDSPVRVQAPAQALWVSQKPEVW